METKHTATPWNYSNDLMRNSGTPGVSIGTTYQIAELENAADGTTAEANAAFIVRAVNSHIPLLAALTDCIAALEIVHADMGKHRCTVDCPDIGKHVAHARAAIAAATERGAA